MWRSSHFATSRRHPTWGSSSDCVDDSLNGDAKESCRLDRMRTAADSVVWQTTTLLDRRLDSFLFPPLLGFCGGGSRFLEAPLAPELG